MSKIQDTTDAIGEIAGSVAGIQTVYTKPTIELTRKLPCVLVMYDGFDQAGLTLGTSGVTYKFVLTVYYDLDTIDIAARWEDVLNLSNRMMDAFRDVNIGSALISQITGGKPIIAATNSPTAKPKWIGHRFDIEALIEEA